MRISDWSSDVCSSDLLAPHMHCILSCLLSAMRPRLFRKGAGGGHGRQLGGRAAVYGDHLAADEPGGVRREEGDHRSDILRLAQIGKGGMALVHIDQLLRQEPLDAFGQDHGRRSEEHTSELQSLMRHLY